MGLGKNVRAEASRVTSPPLELASSWVVWGTHLWGKKKRLKSLLKTSISWGAWVAQLVEHLTLDLGSGHDLTVREIKPHVGLCTDSMEAAWDSVCLSVSLPHALSK